MRYFQQKLRNLFELQTHLWATKTTSSGEDIEVANRFVCVFRVFRVFCFLN